MLAPYYTDTDREIGGISDHLGDNCKILYGGWIAPKLYFLEYVEKNR